MVESLLESVLYVVPVLMIGSGFLGVDAFLAVTGISIVGLAGGSIGYSLEVHDLAVFAAPIKQLAILFVVGLIGLPVAKWTEEKKAGIR